MMKTNMDTRGRFWLEKSGVPKSKAREIRLLAGNKAEFEAAAAHCNGDDHETVYNDVWFSEQKRLFVEWQKGVAK